MQIEKPKQKQTWQTSSKGRSVVKVIQAMNTSDGAGVKLRRSLGTDLLPDLDPFLMLDEFRSDQAGDYIAGFPDHPHRGFETMTYMLAGAMQHKDHLGNTGDLRAGSVQWMTAGRGIIHSEMPRQENGLMWGYQLWINLPAAQKMTEPRYQDIPPEDIPELELPGGKIRVIAGTSSGVKGPVTGIATEPLFVDITLPANSSLSHDVPAGHNGFVYVVDGQGQFGKSDQTMTEAELGALNKEGNELKIKTGERGVRFLLLAAQPIGEPVARYGPFVMNTTLELEQAFEDFRTGKF